MATIDVAQFLGKSKTFVVDGKEVVVEPFGGEDLDLFVGDEGESKSDFVKRLVMARFKLTEEEFRKLPISFINKAAEAIVEINGLKPSK